MKLNLIPTFALVCTPFLSGCDDADNDVVQQTMNSADSPIAAVKPIPAGLTGDVAFSTLMAHWKTMHESESAFYDAARSYFNCYAYAAGSTGSPYYTNIFGEDVTVMAVPGAMSGEPMKIFTAQELHEAVVSDGFMPIAADIAADETTDDLERTGHRLVAAFIDSRIDDGNGFSYHFAVRDDEGRWSHKNGRGEVEYEDFHGADLPEPHVSPERYLGPRYDFAGYYWRPDTGINVTAGPTPVGALGDNGSVVREGLFDPDDMRSDIWIGTRSDYLMTSNTIESLDVIPDNGRYTIFMNGDTELTVPDNLVFAEYRPDSFDRTGNAVFELMDNTGTIFRVIAAPDGDIRQIITPRP